MTILVLLMIVGAVTGIALLATSANSYTGRF